MFACTIFLNMVFNLSRLTEVIYPPSDLSFLNCPRTSQGEHFGMVNAESSQDVRHFQLAEHTHLLVEIEFPLIRINRVIAEVTPLDFVGVHDLLDSIVDRI